MEFSSDPVLQVKNLTVAQQDNVILREVNLQLQKGDFMYLIGQTGSGKSSLLKTLYADLPPAKGEAKIAGYNLSKISMKDIPYLRRKIGIVYQDFQLLEDRTAEENLIFVLKATGWKEKSKIKKRLVEVLGRVGLSGKIDKYPHQLSGGEQQRVAIARALLNEPAVLLADEPTGNLDPEVSDSIMEIFQKISISGTAVLMATHNYDLLKKFPAKTLKCSNGKVVEFTTET